MAPSLSIHTVFVSFILLAFAETNFIHGHMTSFPLLTSFVANKPLTSTVTRMSFSTSTSIDGCNTMINGDLGLLKGVNPKSSDFFTEALDISQLTWLSQPGVLWDAAQKDYQLLKDSDKPKSVEKYMKGIKENLIDYLYSEAICDREDYFDFLRDVILAKGIFALVLGGKSVGKSMVLKRIGSVVLSDEQKGRYMILYLDARTFSGDISEGLSLGVAELKAKTYFPNKFNEDNWAELLLSLSDFVGEGILAYAFKMAKSSFSLKDGDLENFKKVLGPLLTGYFGEKPPDAKNQINDFVKFAESQNKHPILIVDEANKVLGDQNPATSMNLDYIVSATKQDMKMNLILATSEHAYPYQLERQGLNLVDIDDIFVAGDISPKNTWELYTTSSSSGGKICMGPNVAKVLISSHGGHLLFTRRAVAGAVRMKESFALGSSLPDLDSNVFECLYQDGKKNKEAEKLLRSMCLFGFASLENNKNPTLEMISKMNIGGIVRKGQVGLVHRSWKEGGYALVPSGQSVRLVIAQILRREEEKKAGDEGYD